MVVIPSLTDIIADDNLREGISGEGKWPVLREDLFLIFQGVCGLNVGFPRASGGDKINLFWHLSGLSGLILFGAVYDSYVDFTVANTEIIVENVLHDMRHFQLTESDAYSGREREQ